MIKPERVPRDSIIAARNEIRKRFQNEIEEPDVIRHMIAAAINAWPDHFTIGQDGLWCFEKGTICLRPPKEEK